MCRMALIISKNTPLNTFEMVMKSSWAAHNDDGVGIYWRDSAKGKPHLARFERTTDMAKVPDDYDRLLIHFRNTTKGIGTHPFICRCRPDLASEQWLLIHNGSVDDESARESLKVDQKGLKSHKFVTDIDSEPFVHLWAEIDEKNLLDRAKAFSKLVNQLALKGWANLIFYNVITDEYVIFVDNAMNIIQSKNRNITIFASDLVWLNVQESKVLGVTDVAVPHGFVIFGKGNKFEVKKDIWKIRSRLAETKIEDTVKCSTFPQGAVDNGKKPTKALYSGTEIVPTKTNTVSRATEAYDSDWGIGAHIFEPSPLPDSDTGETYCMICFLEAKDHDLDHEDLAEIAEMAEKQAKIAEASVETGVQPEVWEPKPRPIFEGHIFKSTGSMKQSPQPSKKKPSMKLLGNGYVVLKMTEDDLCRPQDDPEHPSSGICQRHWEMGFRSFSHEIDGWYLVKQVAYTPPTAEDSFE